ncbi:MAG: hypothetical protein GFH27_549307n212 [Chloroflexi bacterium AL-W]|nr:hypothetical protein [Chloroflexi bacterium AL-N1]NOK69245.1 hypothetical protein [Chloroflexi bacterium AL-N10]NOK77228.1 hypothetical protein [Chloroflexi bacterium AL-N5]NOK83872.1 hypothetical protein [Chloroflexi bacterium AL-W]NOK91083.1 hypothetical protein [Chloroflexi bacterium AL-N15]
MIEIPLSIEIDSEDTEVAEVLVDGVLEGHNQKFLLDTGAAKTSVRYDNYTAKFETVENSKISGVFAESQSDIIALPRLEIGSLVKENYSVERMAKANQEAHNLIGMDILKDYCCHFIFDENKLVIDLADSFVGNLGLHKLFLDAGFHPYVNVQFGEIKAEAVWDTGSGVTAVDTNFIEKHPTLFEEIGTSVGTDATGSKLETSEFMMAASVIGREAFSPHKVVGIDFSRMNASLEKPMNLLLGYTTRKKANWLFDFPNKVWAITKVVLIN